MNKEALLSLREQILSDVTPLVLDSTTNQTDRFALLLRIIQAGNATQEIYTKAYNSAKAMEDKDEQLNALLSLLDEVDFDVEQKNAPMEPEIDDQASNDNGTSEDTPLQNEIQTQSSSQPLT